MAYFPNSSAAKVLDKQCEKCKFGKRSCPIFEVQVLYNHDAVNNDIATKILNSLIADDGTCSMYKEFEDDFANYGQLGLFNEDGERKKRKKSNKLLDVFKKDIEDL